MKCFLLSILCFAFSSASCQTVQDLINDKQIKWVMELETMYLLDSNFDFGIDTIQRHGLTGSKSILKTLSPKASKNDQKGKQEFISQKIYNDIEEQKLVLESLMIPNESISIKKLDEYVYRIPNYYIRYYKVTQIWYYDKRENSLSNYITKVIPIATSHDRKGHLIFQEIGQLDFTDCISKKIFNNKDWMAMSYDNIDLSKGEVLKGSTKQVLKNILFRYPKKGDKLAFESNGNDRTNGNQLTRQQVKAKLKAHSQSVNMIIYDTYEIKRTEFDYPKLSISNLSAQTIGQRWSYDQENNCLQSRVVDIGPAVKRMTPFGTKEFTTPYFVLIQNDEEYTYPMAPK